MSVVSADHKKKKSQLAPYLELHVQFTMVWIKSLLTKGKSKALVT